MAYLFRVQRAANTITMGTVDTTIVIESHTASKILALNASKELEVVTIGTSLNYARPTLNTIQDICTTASPQFAEINLGHADDTTITRVGAGVIAVEGTTVMMVGGAPTAHVHDGDTLQLDAINSDAGAFTFTTGGTVSFNQDITLSGTTTPTITLESTDASDPTFIFKTTNTANQINIYLDESQAEDYLRIEGQTASVDTYVSIQAKDGENAYLRLTSGGNSAWIKMDEHDRLLIKNSVQDMDLIWGINDGSVLKTITWDADVDRLKHSAGLFHFDDDNIETSGTLTCGAITQSGTTLANTYQPLDAVLTDLAALAAVADNEFIVGTGAGTYAHENPATAATSMGLGTGDSPQFTGLTLTGTATVEGASVTVGKANTTTGTLILHDSGSANTITLTVPDSLAGSLSFTLPPTDGDNLDVLQTNGSGVLTWVALSGQTQGDVLDDLNTLGANPFSGDPAIDFLVGTSAGTLAWHSGATARTSIGLGTGDSPTFSNLTVTNAFSIVNLSTTGDTQLGDNVALDNVGINIAPDADVLIKGSFASTGSGDTFCYNNELFTHTEDDSTANTYIYGTYASMTVNDDISANGILMAVGHKQFLEASLTTITGEGTPTAYLYGYHAEVDWAAAALAGATYAACVVGFKADVTGNLGTTGNTIKWGADISVSESAVTNYGGRFTAQGATYNYGVWGYTTGAHTTNYGLYGYAAGATTNWGLYVAAGASYFAGVINIQESATSGDIDSGWGQLWVKNTAPTELWFRDDTGVDFQLGTYGGVAPVDGTPTKVYTKYLTGTLDADDSTDVAHGVTDGLTKILSVTVAVYSDTSYNMFILGEFRVDASAALNCLWGFDDDIIKFREVGTYAQGNDYRIEINYIL